MIEESNKKRILIRAPEDEHKSVLLFPFLIYLKKEYEDSDIFIIKPDSYRNTFEFLPFRVQVFDLPKEKDTFIGIRNFSLNTNDIFNVDIFIDLEGNLKSSFTGIVFRAKERIGIQTGANKLLQNKKINLVESQSLDRIYHNVLESLLDKKIPLEQVIAADIELKENEIERIKVIDPYLLVNINADFYRKHKDTIEEIIKELSSINFVFLNYENYFAINDLEKKYERVFVVQDHSKDNIAKLILNSKGALTSSDWFSHVVNFYGVDSYSFTETLESYPTFDAFKRKPDLLVYENDKLIKHIHEAGEDNLENISSFVDKIASKLNI